MDVRTAHGWARTGLVVAVAAWTIIALGVGSATAAGGGAGTEGVQVPQAPQVAEVAQDARASVAPACPTPAAEQSAVCVQPGGPVELPAREVRSLAAQPFAIQPLPEWCYDHAFDGWWRTRTQACQIASWVVTVTRIVEGVPVVIGTANVITFNYSYTSSDLSNWAHQMEVGVSSGVGDIAGLAVQGSSTCVGACVVTSASFPPQPAPINSFPSGEAFYETTVTAGTTGLGDTSWSFFFTKPAATPSAPATIPAPAVRCDQALPGRPTSVGCVFPSYVPVMAYSRTGPYPELARHIGDAQASGLPGAYPDGAPLTRLTGPQVNANRDRACPRGASLPRPPGKQCDEYPFASTYQGAATGGGDARTFPWCSIDGPSGTGPVGFSRCMIDAEQNRDGGNALNRFYIDNRVLDGDPFRVWIVE